MSSKKGQSLKTPMVIPEQKDTFDTALKEMAKSGAPETEDDTLSNIATDIQELLKWREETTELLWTLYNHHNSQAKSQNAGARVSQQYHEKLARRISKAFERDDES